MNTSVAGVYEIVNTTNGHRYVGSSVNVTNRLYEHRNRLMRGVHTNKHLQGAWNKYGKDNFVFRPLLYCDVKNTQLYEQICLDGLQPEYNISVNAQAFALGLKHSEEYKKKIGLSKIGNKKFLGHKHSEETKKRLSELASNRRLTEEHKKKIGQSMIGNKHLLGYKHTEETKKRIGNSQLGNKHTLGYVPNEETRLKMSKAQMGRTQTLETRRKISIAKKIYWIKKHASISAI
jgi:group I intron endonuclease